MHISCILTLAALAQAVLAAHFKVIAPGGNNVEVSVNGINTKLTAPDADVPYFVGEVNAPDNSKYKYVVNGKAESFERTLSGASTRNDIYLRPVTYASIPGLPKVIGVNDWTRAIEPEPIWDINYIPSVFITLGAKERNSLVKKLSKSIYKAKITIIDADNVHTFEGANFQLHKPGKPHNNAKQSWKWKLPEGQLLNGRDFFKIRHMEEDPTQIREKLYADVLRAMGVYAPQANMIRFFINKESFGTFNMLDDVPTFSYIQAVFNGGNPLPSTDLVFDGASGASFKDDDKNLYAFIPAEDGETSNNDKSMIEAVVKELEQLDPQNDQQVEEFKKQFDVDQFLRFMVMEFLTCHWDGYWQQQTNIGAYVDSTHKILYFLGQDFDGTFGINAPNDWDIINTPYTDYPGKFEDAVMINKLLENPKIKATFESYLKATVSKVFNNAVLGSHVLEYHNFIMPDLEWDRSIKQQSKGINYDWKIEHVTENLYNPVSTGKGGGADYGLISYIDLKSKAVAQQLGLTLP
ncbi:coth protein-domain-containing protein [Chlamydoabsidia padenii]|nr:coth protein-domain-containing protein [Chlamydoabsidia padenii]